MLLALLINIFLFVLSMVGYVCASLWYLKKQSLLQKLTKMICTVMIVLITIESIMLRLIDGQDVHYSTLFLLVIPVTQLIVDVYPIVAHLTKSNNLENASEEEEPSVEEIADE